MFKIGNDALNSELQPELREGVGQPAVNSIREQLERVLSNPEFMSTDNRKAFLRYIIEETLAGRADRLKGFSIAMSVFRRDESFDPQTDPVVRLEARRLRRELEHYYLTTGRDDPIRISIPKGAYVPKFAPATSRPPDQPERRDAGLQGRPTETGGRRRSVSIAIALGALVAVTLGGILWLTSGRGPGREPVSRAIDDVVSLPGTPVIAVLPFAIIGDSPIGQQLAVGLSEDVVTELSYLAGLQVIAYGSSSRLADREHLETDIISQLGATHLLRGRIQIEDSSFRINVRLEDLHRHRQIWADSFDYQLENLLLAQTNIARRVSTALAVTFPDNRSEGIERTAVFNIEARALTSQAIGLSAPPSDPVRVQAATLLFKRAIELEPQAPSSYAGLAYLQATAAWFGSVQDIDSALETAVVNARKSISLDRNSVQALLALAVVAMMQDDYEKAIEHLDSAIVAQPSSALAYAWRGLMLTYAGQARQGVRPLLTATRLDPINSRTPYLNMLAIAYFHSGDIKSAIETIMKNLENGGPHGPHMAAYIIAGYFHLGEMDKARQAFQEFLKIENGFPLERWFQLSFQYPKDVENVLGPLQQLRTEK